MRYSIKDTNVIYIIYLLSIDKSIRYYFIREKYKDIMYIIIKMKLFLFLLFLILIKNIQSKKSIRKYLLIRDEKVDKNGLSQFSILDSIGKEYLYRLKTSNDGVMIISYPSKDIVGYLEGEWINEIFYLNTNQWTNGTIQKIFYLFIEKYLIQ
jgi:hypothetical protein